MVGRKSEFVNNPLTAGGNTGFVCTLSRTETVPQARWGDNCEKKKEKTIHPAKGREPNGLSFHLRGVQRRKKDLTSISWYQRIRENHVPQARGGDIFLKKIKKTRKKYPLWGVLTGKNEGKRVRRKNSKCIKNEKYAKLHPPRGVLSGGGWIYNRRH